MALGPPRERRRDRGGSGTGCNLGRLGGAGSADRTTLTALTERALRVELARLAITHNHGQPFAPRDP